jgi:hypothetical protein
MNKGIQQEQSKLFEELGVFFAFGNKQFNEQRVAGVEYCSVLQAGDCVPVNNASEFAQRLAALQKAARDTELAEKGIERIIEDALVNHECFYTGYVSDAVDVLAHYEVTLEQVRAIYFKVMHKYEDW